MDIEYEVNIDDLVAFNLYYYSHSPQIKRQMKTRQVIYLGTALLALIFAIIFTITKPWSWHVIVFLYAYFIFVLFAYIHVFKQSNMEKRIRKELDRRYGQGRNDIIGKHQLSITPVEIKDTTEMGEQTTCWEAIEEVVNEVHHYFLVIRGSSSAYIIPKRAFTSESHAEKFLEKAVGFFRAENHTAVWINH